ncbi:MAG: hypothetical protein ACP5SB_03770 [Caldisericaceae bacterium]
MNNTNYIDVAVFLILVIEFFIGMRNGIILLLSDILSIVGGWFAAKAFTDKVAIFLDGQFNLVQKLSVTVGNLIHIPQNLSALPATMDNLLQVIANLNLPAFLKNYITKDFAANSLNIQAFVDIKLASLLLNGIVFAAIFMVTVGIVRIAGLFIRRAIKVSPFLNWIDIVFGGVFKIVLAAIVLAIIAQALAYVFGFFNLSGNSFINEILNSRFYAFSLKALPQITRGVSNIISGIH